MSTRNKINGTLWVDNRPCSAQEILLVTGDAKMLIGVGITNSDGQFSFDLPHRDWPAEAVVLVKLKTTIVGMVHELVQIGGRQAIEIRVDTNSGFFQIDGKIDRPSGFPDCLDLFLDPIRVDGLPRIFERFFLQSDEAVFDAHFFRSSTTDTTFSFRVKRGVYKIGGEYIIYERPNIVDPAFNNYIVEQVRLFPRGGALKGDTYDGFVLDVSADRNVGLLLRILNDEELG